MLNNLIAWEIANGYKSKYVAKRLGLTDAQYSRIKHGYQKPPLEVAERFIKEFAVDDVFTLLKNF